MEIPNEIGGADVLLFSPIDNRHQATSLSARGVGVENARDTRWVAICRHPAHPGYYVFRCYPARQRSDTHHETIDAARACAEQEYQGLVRTWVATV